MSWRPFVAIGTATFAFAASSAHAQSDTGVLFTSGSTGGTVVTDTNIDVRATGELVVSFHGDPAAGCATEGLCRYTGTVIARPGAGGLFISTRRHGRHFSYSGSLSLGLGPNQGVTFARVNRENSAGVCADAQQLGAFSPLPLRGAFATIPLLSPGGGRLSTRCAGPTEADLAGALPRITVPVSSLLKGTTTQLDLSANRPFTGRGFAGTATSTVILHLGRPRQQNVSSRPRFPRGIKTERVRTLTEVLTGVRGTGSVTALVNGSADTTECELLDSCGLAGTLTFSPNWSHLGGFLYATGPAKRSYRDFLAALGLARGNPRGIQVYGTVASSRDGVLSAEETQSGTCTDSTALAGSVVTIGPRGHSMVAAYLPATPSRTRCPGPVLPEGRTLASGNVSPSELRHRTFTLSLTGQERLQDDGYTAATRGRLTLTLRRGRITQHVITQPAGF